jgi:hypothetical protein
MKGKIIIGETSKQFYFKEPDNPIDDIMFRLNEMTLFQFSKKFDIGLDVLKHNGFWFDV